ncbi:Cache domain family protein [Sneathiella sp. P13V-1]|uniref:cache domain-containing protein n=1 Tax=Sneathiella sp. P13V-1 TaxID=2697366 RepID=UPI00187B16FB|nr:cache domain-containing protein [Sneathiella sp. P13V-1]MBE7636003.1 Cache domain family protein [Sneathiella sp. P13V-1]
MFKKLALSIFMGVFFVVGAAHAEDKKAHVLSMMDKAIAHYKSVGQEQAFKDFAVEGEFKNGEFYVIGQSISKGSIIFHGANEKLIGKNLQKVKDTDGKAFVAEMSELAATKGTGWVDYKWPHPETKKIAQKYTYVTRVDDSDTFLMIGYYE